MARTYAGPRRSDTASRFFVVAVCGGFLSAAERDGRGSHMGVQSGGDPEGEKIGCAKTGKLPQAFFREQQTVRMARRTARDEQAVDCAVRYFSCAGDSS